MKDEIIAKVETKITEVEGNLKKLNESIAVLSSAIKNQIASKKNMEAEALFLAGVIQAYKSITAEKQVPPYQEVDQIEVLEESNKNV